MAYLPRRVKLLPSTSPLCFPPDDIIYGLSLSRGFMVTLPSFVRTVFRCPRLTLWMVGNPLTSSTGQSQSQAIGEVVGPGAALFGIAISPERPCAVQSASSKSRDLASVAFPCTSRFGSSPPFPARTVSSARTLLPSLLGWDPTALTAWPLFPHDGLELGSGMAACVLVKMSCS